MVCLHDWVLCAFTYLWCFLNPFIILCTCMIEYFTHSQSVSWTLSAQLALHVQFDTKHKMYQSNSQHQLSFQNASCKNDKNDPCGPTKLMWNKKYTGRYLTMAFTTSPAWRWIKLSLAATSPNLNLLFLLKNKTRIGALFGLHRSRTTSSVFSVATSIFSTTGMLLMLFFPGADVSLKMYIKMSTTCLGPWNGYKNKQSQLLH